MPVVTTRSAVCLLGRFPALAGADLDVDAGDVVLVSGPNGAGKSTLLRLLAGLLPLRSGSAVVLGHDLAVDRRGVRRSVALVGHDAGAYDDLTVAENLRFATRAAGRPEAAIGAVLERVGLAHRADVPHGRLSGGQRRRLALAVALAREADLLLLDEPHAGLDAEARAIVDEVVTDAPHQGRTVVVATHELEHVRGLVTREVRVAAGRLSGGLRPGPAPGAPAAEVGAAPEQVPGDAGGRRAGAPPQAPVGGVAR